MAENALYQPRIDGEMRATQPRNALLGLLADALYAADKYAQRPNPSMPMGKANPPLSLLSSALGLGDIAATADRYNMRQDLTRGSGWATQMLPETANALLSVGPAVAKYPKQAAVAAGLLSGDTSAAMKAATVWHGSPHKFDKFDSSKIGTGEGSQAFGHGLYLAETPEVSRQYAAIAAKPGLKQGSAIGNDMGVLDGLIKLNARKYTDGDVNALAELIKKRPQAFAKSDELLARIPEYVNNQPPGYLYKVDLPDSAISRMLDWDKPLSQQPEAVKNILDDLFMYPPSNTTGQEIYTLTQNSNKGGATRASDILRKAGIPGVRYLDGGSRGAGAGTSNFVVFPGEEGLLSILERNGVPVK